MGYHANRPSLRLCLFFGSLSQRQTAEQATANTSTPTHIFVPPPRIFRPCVTSAAFMLLPPCLLPLNVCLLNPLWGIAPILRHDVVTSQDEYLPLSIYLWPARFRRRKARVRSRARSCLQCTILHTTRRMYRGRDYSRDTRAAGACDLGGV